MECPARRRPASFRKTDRLAARRHSAGAMTGGCGPLPALPPTSMADCRGRGNGGAGVREGPPNYGRMCASAPCAPPPFAMPSRPFPVIGLTTYGRSADGRFTLPGEYVDAVRRAGGIPLLVAPGEPNWEAVLR